MDILTSLQKTELEKFRSNPDKAKGLLNAGIYQIDKNMDRALIASNTVVASTIMNSDATITKR
jgi:hypothetical protein